MPFGHCGMSAQTNLVVCRRLPVTEQTCANAGRIICLRAFATRLLSLTTWWCACGRQICSWAAWLCSWQTQACLDESQESDCTYKRSNFFFFLVSLLPAQLCHLRIMQNTLKSLSFKKVIHRHWWRQTKMRWPFVISRMQNMFVPLIAQAAMTWRNLRSVPPPYL